MPPRRAKQQPGPGLFDYLDEAELTPELSETPTRSFAERVGKSEAPPATFAERVRPMPSEAPTLAPTPPAFSSGEKSKARDIIAAIRTLQQVEKESRPASPTEREVLARFCGFGPVALSIFPNPATGEYKNAGWQALGEEMKGLLTPDEYASAKRTTFNAFYTSPVVISAMHSALTRLGVPDNALVLEPGAGTGNFLLPGKRYIGVEMDSISGRIAKALHPDQDIRIEDFQKTRLPELDAVIGNVPFADLKLEHNGQKFALHDYFFAKSADALAPGGVMALVTTHYTLDKQNAAIREYLADRADFLGAIRLPSDAFKREGTAVVTDIVFMRKRSLDEPPNHAGPEWLKVDPVDIDGHEVTINRYFRNHPEMVLGAYSGKDSLYGSGYSVVSNGDLTEQLREAIKRLPERVQKTAENDHVRDSCPRIERIVPTSFIPPPLDRHISEGSFFVHEGRIHQLVDGQAVPVVYGGGELWASGALVGRRMGALIELRDKARRVLQSQNEGWPESARDDARKDLNRSYDWFRSAYGPINKTTISESKDGSAIRRMPNLVKFREDPDAMLVMALEEYDEATGEAKKAPIMRKDVVGKTPPVTSVATAEDGLLVSLDHKGSIDLPYIAKLYGKPEDVVVSELGDHIYRDPASKEWQTADAYLSGNVRAKLAVAEAAGPEFARNADALRAVQPEDVLPGDIDANLGAPWIPASDIQAFAADLFRTDPSSFTVGHLAKDAVWSIEGDYSAQRSVPVTADYGTSRANGIWLLDLALNQKSPVIYDPDPNDPDKRVVNQQETLAAKEKQKLIKEQFKGWVFSDPDRTERLVRLYNDTFNCMQPRVFDGSHLVFPGMSNVFTLRPHQKDAIWRVMSGGNTLLAHVVGGGKSAIQAAAAMKMRETGLARKIMCVCPNHLLEQYGREFQHLYPNAKLLIATKDDLARDRRKQFTAKIASGDWDAIIVTHSSFERIGMSKEFQERFLRQQIEEYDELLTERAADRGRNRNLLKTIEKQKASREAKLKDLLAEDKKDGGLVFDELGVDYVFYDESAAVKNLETPTKMDRVAGINTGGSERAFDMLMKAHYLHQKHPGHGITFANGTPVSNSMVEMYTTQRFLDPDALRARGVEHFDAWAATFGEVVESMEISPDGKTLKPRSRFAKFVNLPELQQMFRQFADVQTAEMLNLPRPALEGGKPHVVACPMSDEQHALQEELVKRYDRIRSARVDPREDNALAITTDGRKLALDARMLSAAAKDFPGSKVNALVENVSSIWKRTADTKGAQIVFCDMGINPTTWGYSPYEEIIQKLVGSGVPREQIATIGDADTDAKKQALFEKVRQGSVRVLLGSTAKLGTGTNVQKRLVALHHLDAPWKPAEVEQRDGRILRQGNSNAEVAVYRYVTEGSFDSFMWQTLETKAKFISQVITGESAVRRADDVAEQALSYAEVKAIASGNPAVLVLAEADAELQRLAVLRKSHLDEQYLARKNLRELPQTIGRLEKRIAALESDLANAAGGDGGVITVGNRNVSPQEPAFANALSRIPEDVTNSRQYPLGRYRGLAFGIVRHPGGAGDVYLEGELTRHAMLSKDSQGPRAVMNSLNRIVGSYEEERDHAVQDKSLAESQLADYQARLGRPFVHAAFLDELTRLRDELKTALSAPPPAEDAEPGPSSADLAAQIKALRASHTVEVAPIRPKPQKADTAKMRRRAEVIEMPKQELPTEIPTSLPTPPPDEDDSPPASFRQQVRGRPVQRSLF
ncbi:MAG: DEAD/DEAH box helicase family protein [Planctomycetes bacterium]|nr:DEAD/DEAH box helicase family protein [Planctomycetota bacterium]